MSHAQQALYRMCEAAGRDAVARAYETMQRTDRRDLKFLTTRAVLAFYLKGTLK